MKRRAILIVVVMGVALVLLSSGAALAALNVIECDTGRACTGTEARDLMNGTDGHNEIYGEGAADILKGFGGLDLLYGERGNDLLYGGEGSDELYGGAYIDDLFPGRGNDAVLDGGEGGDTYYFETDDWGDDTITDSDTGNQVHFGDRLQFLSSIETDLVISLVSKPGSDEVSNTAGSTINWDGDVIESVVNSGAGDDRIYGNDAANTIISKHGGDKDTIYGGGGDEYIDVSDGSGGDYVDCGESANDHDAAIHDPGDRVINCES